jgi:hypothetical protein
MTDFWRRKAVESELMRGAVHRRNRDFFGEVAAGRIEDSGVFECGPCGVTASNPHRPIRLYVQACSGVAVLARRRLSPGGDLQEIRWENLIAIGARGGHEDQHYLWVQIYSDADEEIVDFSGSTRTENINRNLEAPDIDHPDVSFPWASRTWTVDNSQTNSARYPLAQPTLGSPNCETIYDGPTSELGLRSYFQEHRTVRRIRKTTQFQSFVYQVPILRTERASVFLPRLQPTASVAWSFDEVLGREQPDGDVRVLEQRYRVHYIHPNGVAPAGMTRAMWRVFHGR